MQQQVHQPDMRLLAKVGSLMERGMVQAARELAQNIVKAAPNSFEALYMLASATQNSGDLTEAVRLLEKCLSIKPKHAGALVALAQALHYAGRTEDAVAVCNRGLALNPGDVSLHLWRATALEQNNRFEEAWDLLQPLLGREKPVVQAASLACRILFGLKQYDASIEWGQRALQFAGITDADRRTIHKNMARVYDKLGRYDEAFAASQAAHATLSKSFDTDRYLKHVDSLIATFSGASLRMLSRSNNASEIPVFVIGMPRSGTSLIEQIIASHPRAYGAGEINDFASIAHSITTETGSMYVYPDSLADLTPAIADRIADRYIQRLQELGGAAERVTNKMLEQYEHVGLIWLLLPKARVIHVQRDPLDICLSCYTRHLNHERLPYATSLEHLGLVHRQHERLMEHWKRTLDLRFLTVKYEDVVANQEARTREIIDFVGLPWDDRCLRYYEADRTVMTLSYDQVNKPIYDSSIGRWRNYERHLDPLKEALEAG